MLRIENGLDYKPGGFPPVHIGDTFENRYRIIHKLGHGGFATVWLARDLRQHRYVAIKMTKSSQTKPSETEVFRSLASHNSSHPGRRHVDHPRNSFKINSPNGVHECLVFDLRGPSISSLQNEAGYRQLQGRTARVLCQQLLKAVAYLHSQKIVHGDITPGNLLLGLKEEIHQCSEQQILDRIGYPAPEPELIDMFFENGQEATAAYPRYLVGAANLWGLGTMITADIYLSDFGEAFDAAKIPIRHRAGGIPLAYKAPEMLFERVQGFAADKWAAACCIHYIRFGYDLMYCMGGAKFLVDEMIDQLGNLPHQWSKLYFDRRGTAKRRSRHAQNKAGKGNIDIDALSKRRLEPEELEDWPKNSVDQPLLMGIRARTEEVQSVGQVPKSRHSTIERLDEKRLEVQITKDEATCMADLLSRLLMWNPQDRAEPDELLEHQWFDKSKFTSDDIAANASQPLLQVNIPLP